MRLISQNGAMDIPYDNVSLYIECHQTIAEKCKGIGNEMTFVYCKYANGEVEEIARYDTCEKAVKVMKALRKHVASDPFSAYFQFPDTWKMKPWFDKYGV